MKAAIVEIGHLYVLCPSPTVATKLVELLSKTMAVRREYRDGAERYHPTAPDDTVYNLEVSLKLVNPDQVEMPARRVPAGRRLGFTKPLDL